MELENLTLIQGVETSITDGHRLVFFTDEGSLYSRIFRSFLHDKIKDKWIIEGMVHYNRSQKTYHDNMAELADLLGEG